MESIRCHIENTVPHTHTHTHTHRRTLDVCTSTTHVYALTHCVHMGAHTHTRTHTHAPTHTHMLKRRHRQTLTEEEHEELAIAPNIDQHWCII